MSKTYEQCLDEVARKYGYLVWDHYTSHDNANSDGIEVYMKEAALLYGEIMYQNGYFEALKDIQNLRDHSNDISKPIKF